MKFSLYIYTLLALPVFSHATNCEEELQKHLRSDLSLSYQEFDQTMGGGMRALSALGCHAETADLIEAYIEHNNASERSLRWHIAQQRAMAGEYDEAIDYARSVLSDSENFEKNPFRWNDYVLATIAFLEADKESLIRHRENVAKGKEQHQGNAINLRFLDLLVENFGASYADATR